MKKTWTWLCAALCVVCLLAGCGRQGLEDARETSSEISSLSSHASAGARSSSGASASSGGLSPGKPDGSNAASYAVPAQEGAAAGSSAAAQAGEGNNGGNTAAETGGDHPSVVASSESQGSGNKAASRSSSGQEQNKTQEAPAQVTVTLSVDCTAAVEYGNDIAASVSSGGAIISGKSLTLGEGASVYDALKASGLVIGSSSSAMGTYVYSIQSLAEKACGANSGWLYSVNGTNISKSCDKYTLANGDQVRWTYTV